MTDIVFVSERKCYTESRRAEPSRNRLPYFLRLPRDSMSLWRCFALLTKMDARLLSFNVPFPSPPITNLPTPRSRNNPTRPSIQTGEAACSCFWLSSASWPLYRHPWDPGRSVAP